MRCYHILYLLISIAFGCGAHEDYEEVVVRVIGGPPVAQLLAEESGYIFKGAVKGFQDTYILQPSDEIRPVYSKRGSEFVKRLSSDARILWAEAQTKVNRQKRDLLDPSDIPHMRVKRIRNNEINPDIKPTKYQRAFNDELWSQQWYLQDTRMRPDTPKLDLNVLPVYKAGLTGEGIRIAILDDGLEYTHEDLSKNYDPEISWDCNDDDDDPTPRYDSDKSNSHGTRCAGEIAMVANNGICGVGVAFNSKVGGIRMLDGLVNDRIEGTALGHAHELVDIYSASWGPNDDGKTVDGPGRLAREAMERGIREGRNGKGVIYVWASGNGGSNGDNCNCDGYLASPYTISIGSASQKGEFPWYGEACASTLAVTYSSGAYKDQMITTTDLNDECTIKHTGTSASAPLAAGIIALALEVNPNLTWRDVQHLIVWTSEVSPVADNPGWQRNAAGLWFNTRFGFGLMNALSIVTHAYNWTSVPGKSLCSRKIPMKYKHSLSFGNPVSLPILTDGCRNTASEVRYLEHVEVTTNINYTIRGVLEIQLISPSGTKVPLLSRRKLDKSKKGFKNWNFMSVMTWGEPAEGEWLLTITDNVGPEGNFGSIGEIVLHLHGTKHIPSHMKYGRQYDFNYNWVHGRRRKTRKEEQDSGKPLLTPPIFFTELDH